MALTRGELDEMKRRADELWNVTAESEAVRQHLRDLKRDVLRLANEIERLWQDQR